MLVIIKRAIISVSDKVGLVDFASFLASWNVELISTGGTARALSEAGLKVMDVAEYTGFPEMMDGRVKTLHPKVHGALLGVRDNKKHVDAMEAHGIKPVDLLVVNLYPFEKVVAERGVALDTANENIDIGGPAMIRSAAKNHRYTTVVVEPSQYEAVMYDMNGTDGGTTLDLRQKLKVVAFQRTAAYDQAIAAFFSRYYLTTTK